jgi:Putative metallopeptidase
VRLLLSAGIVASPMKPLLVTALAVGAALHAGAALAQEPRTDQVRTIYEEPTEGKYRVIRDAMREWRILETVGALLNAFRLPRELTLVVRGCEGRETAWYERDKAYFCYEYVDLIQRHAPKIATPGGVQRADAIVGAVIDTLLHESGHAIFDLLDIPVMGREEDAADFFSIYWMLQFPPQDARRLIEGIAFNMGSEARQDFSERPEPRKFAGPHGPNVQRHYNVLCLAYAANAALFNNEVPAGLPAWRARTCWEEWAMLRRAFAKLILPHVDEARLKDALAQARFEWSPLLSETGKADKPPLGD